MFTIYVYQLTSPHLPGKAYIGSSKDVAARFQQHKSHSSTLKTSVEECVYLLVAVVVSSKSSGSAVVSLTHLKSPQQHEKFLQFDFNDARTMRPKKAKNAPESVSQNELPNSSYHAIYLTYVWRV